MTRVTRQTMKLLVLIALIGGGAPAAQNAPYVGAYEADTFFSTITSNEMDVLRTKKILFASRSFGLNMVDGLTRLKVINPMHDLLSSYIRYDVLNNGLSSIPTNVFSSYNFVHFLCTYWPQTKRLDEVDTLLRQTPYSFGSQVDVVMIYYDQAQAGVFDTYTNVFDTLRADYPGIKFVYVTAGYEGIGHVTENTNSTAFNLKARAAFKGKVPLYDLGYLMNNDGEGGDGFLPEYSLDPSPNAVHPSAPFAEERLGRAFLLVLRDIYFGSGCTNFTPPTVPANLSGTALSDTSIRLTWEPSEHECGISRYELTRDGLALPSTTKTNYTDAGLTENTPYHYAIRAVSMGEVASVYSSTSTVSTLVDSTAPTMTLARAVSGTEVSIEFNENMDPVSCGVATNYTLNNGVSVLSASLSGKTVTLTTSAMADGTLCTLTLNNVADGSSAKNQIVSGSQASFTYLRVLYPGDPTAYWPLDGTTNDISGNALNGVWVGSSSYGPALLGQGMALSGTAAGSYMRVGYNSLLDGMSQLSVSVWARKNTATVGGQLFRKHTVYALEATGTGLKGYVTGTGTVNISVTTVASLNNTNWHHYALVYNGTNVFTYVDGARQSSGTLNGNLGVYSSGANGNLNIGENIVNSPYLSFAGDIDEMKLFRRALSTNEITALFTSGIAGHADRLAVRAILDTNNLTNKQVDAISVYQYDRITKLYLQESGVSNLTSEIGQLSELNLLHVYGDRALGHPLLSRVASEIGNCTKLTEMDLSQNSLTNLPAAITNLTKLAICSIGDNLLCGSYPWENWANSYDPDWRATQDCPASFYYIYSTLHGPGSVFPTNRLAIGAGQSTQLVYSANAWHKLTGFSGNGLTVPSAIGHQTYTAVYVNVSADITNEVTFSVVRAEVDGNTPATWYGPLNANPAVADEDQDSLSLAQEYLINSNPAQSNTFQMIAAGLDTAQRVGLSWRSLGLPNGQVRIGLQHDLNGSTIYPAGTTVYSNGVCTWRSSEPVTNNAGFIRLKINSTP